MMGIITEPIMVLPSISPMAVNLFSKRHAGSGFDGNRTDIISQWYFPKNDLKADWDEIMSGLMGMTEEGHLRWCLFLVPPNPDSLMS